MFKLVSLTQSYIVWPLMERLLCVQVIAGYLLGAGLAQYVDHKQAKILKEQRFNAGDGRYVIK